MFSEDDLSRDDFLDGKLRIWQPRQGYRAATDPVLLAASVDHGVGKSILDMGCGVGTALLCVGVRLPDAELVGVELQTDYAELAIRNVAENNMSAQICSADIAHLPLNVRERTFDEVITNPPFFEPERATASDDKSRDVAHRETHVRLEQWIRIALRRVAPKGYFTVIHRAERLGVILSALQGSTGDICVKPLVARQGRDAGRVIVRARKGAAGPLRLLSPLIMHEGPVHREDGDDFSREARGILRQMQPLSLKRIDH